MAELYDMNISLKLLLKKINCMPQVEKGSKTTGKKTALLLTVCLANQEQQTFIYFLTKVLLSLM